MDDLQLELVSLIAECVGPADLASMRLTSQALLAGVQNANVSLRPSREIEPAQLGRIFMAFAKIATIDVSGSTALNSNTLLSLRNLTSLRYLCFDARYGMLCNSKEF